MNNVASALHPSLLTDPTPRGLGVAGWLREQVSYLNAMRELNALDRRTLDDIGVSPDQFPMLARRHARGLPPIERSTGSRRAQ